MGRRGFGLSRKLFDLCGLQSILPRMRPAIIPQEIIFDQSNFWGDLLIQYQDSVFVEMESQQSRDSGGGLVPWRGKV